MSETTPSAAMDFDIAPTRLTVDLGAIVENWRLMAKASGAAEASAVVKANAYGLGAQPVARALAAAGCRTFFVATVAEGVGLRAVCETARIFVLNGGWDGWQDALHRHRLIPVLSSAEQLSFHATQCRDLAFGLNVDTGMNRLGLTVAEAKAYAASAQARPVLVMSHLACSDDPQHPMNAQQRAAFQQVSAEFRGIKSSLSSSAGIFLGADYHYDLTRPGIALYGGESVQGVANPMQPVVCAEARILQIRNVKEGEYASYGATHRFERDGRIAVVGAGYADGWQRALSGSGVLLRRAIETGAYGFLAGRKVPIVGRVTMDLTSFDISDIPVSEVAPGDYLELFGREINLDEAARAAGTIGYEFF